MAGKIGKYRVKLNLEQIRANVFADEGVELPPAQIKSWLCSVGFVLQSDGQTWVADEHCLRRLQRSEIEGQEPFDLSR